MTGDRLLLLIQRLAGIAQTGRSFAQSEYDRMRFEDVATIAVELATFGENDARLMADIFKSDDGYATPKLIVRAAVFDEMGRVLMTREIADGLWTLPGGWIDIGESAAAAAEREVQEETGYVVRATKVAAVFDKLRHQHPPAPHHAFLIFFLCELIGGDSTTSIETSEVGWFGRDDLPELSLGRATSAQIDRMFDHLHQPDLPTDFD